MQYDITKNIFQNKAHNAMYTGRMAGAAGPPVELKFNCGFAWVAIFVNYLWKRE